MPVRFQIQDLIGQDATGVVFQALDLQTGTPVTVRRFFPFGAAGGGLDADEETAYGIAIGRLAGLTHPALRSVIHGACDPVDRMPFIVTEWIDGDPVEPLIRHEPLPAAVAAQLLMQALEVSELISQVLAEDAVWVETDLRTIVLGSEASGREFTFWISPLKWLGSGSESRGLQPIITLAEDVLHWHGRVIGDQAGGGLGAWLKWLRGAESTTSLREARENLAAALGENPPPTAKNLLVSANRPPIPKKSKTALLLFCGFTLIVIGIGGWLFTGHRMSPDGQDGTLPSTGQAPTGKSGLDAVNERQAELAAKAAEERRELVEREKALVVRGGVFNPEDGGLLVSRKGLVETLEGKVAGSRLSPSGKTLYLYFSQDPDETEARGALRFKGVDEWLANKWIGKTIRLKGKVTVQGQQSEILVTDPQALEVIE